jgi:flagellar hook assembly protein FlgD
MKKLSIGILSLIFFVFIFSCSRNTDPQFRIRNEQLNNVSVKIQTSANNKSSINNIESGQITAYQTVPEGNITVTAVAQNESVSFPAGKNTSYTIIISTGKPPLVQIDK